LKSPTEVNNGKRDEDASSKSGTLGQQILVEYLNAVMAVRSTGAGVPETSYYPALSNLFNAVGKTLKPKVRCVINLSNQGAGIPDGGLFTADQFQRQGDGLPAPGQFPARGAIEVKGTKRNVHDIAKDEQVAGGKNKPGYLHTYGIVIVSNLREFVIVKRGPSGEAQEHESFALADNEQDFWQQTAARPHATAKAKGEPFVEFIKRACLHAAPLVNPKDVAWFMASYARDALFRVESRKELPALQTVRTALEEALGMKFTGENGEHFFRSTLVQTLFYGVFSAWVLWHKNNPARKEKFDWRTAEWSLHVPFIRALYGDVAKPSRLGELKLVEVLDWAAGVLNRVDRSAFFKSFEDEHAVQYFYEPFLEAYDPELRKALGVWYTPPEIVKYQVARVDTVLREELGLADGLADPGVIVLDPCCGTGAYLVEVLHCIAATLRDKGGDALVASDLKQAAMHRVFGFEIMPAPFVVSHLQLGLMLQAQGAPLAHGKEERVGVYLTNALTGWEPPKGPKQQVMSWSELQDERDAAGQIKQGETILVVLGNPPYNAFAGISPEEEQGLVEPYKTNLNTPTDAGGWGIKNDLYIRFFRLAERRIAEMSGRGVVSFISNHSWVSDPSFVVLRQHLLKSFDKFWVENLHGNRKISEYAPDGRTSETIFSISGFSVGIQQGVTTSLWVKTGKKSKHPAQVRFRDDIHDAKAEERRKHLLDSLQVKTFDKCYALANPCPENRYSFRPEDVSMEFRQWVALIDLAKFAPTLGVLDNRQEALIRIERQDVESRSAAYFNPSVTWNALSQIVPELTRDYARFPSKETREKAFMTPYNPANIRRILIRPMDLRWCYYTPIRPVWMETRPKLAAQCWEGNQFLITRRKNTSAPEGAPMGFCSVMGMQHAMHTDAYYVPMQIKAYGSDNSSSPDLLGANESYANLSSSACDYLASLGIKNPDADAKTAGLIWMHALAIGYSPAYLKENADGIRRDWPRIPLPASRKALAASAELGGKLAALLDTEAVVAGVTSGTIAPVLKTIGMISKVGGGALDPSGNDLEIRAGWGHYGKKGVVMPGKGKLDERAYTESEQTAINAEAKARGISVKEIHRLLGTKTCDVYLNGGAYWRNIPLNVWEYYIGGYQVIKKWLSYREDEILSRALKTDEAREVTNTARRIASILLLQPQLDENYRKIKAAAYDWPANIKPHGKMRFAE
jgi:hypothetical protein